MRRRFETDPFSLSPDRWGNLSLDRTGHAQWVEEVYDITAGSSAGETIHGTDSAFLGVSVGARRLRCLATICLLVVAGLIVRASYLQIIRGQYYHGLAEGNRIRVVSLGAPRGVFFDIRGRQLVNNVPSYNLLVTPGDVPTDQATRAAALATVSREAEIPQADLETQLADDRAYPYQARVVKQGLSYDQVIALTLTSQEVDGFELQEGARRQYGPDETAEPLLSLGHIVGYTGQLTREEYEEHRQQGYFLNDIIGKTGLEAVYEKALKGVNGRRTVEVDARGREQKNITATPSVPGEDITLGIDIGLQRVAEESLRASLTQFGKRRGAVVALDPRNGAIRALVSWPSFDANAFAVGLSSTEYTALATDPNQPLFNRAVSGVYPSGSTVKPVMATAALTEGVINEHTSFTSVGGVRIGQWFFPDWKAGGHGVTDVRKAIAESVNTFFYMIGGGMPRGGNPASGEYDFTGLGPERISDWLKRFGLGEKTGIDLPAENAGFVPTVEWKNRTTGEPWYIGDTYNLSIGQGNLLVTPLQVALWTATVANGGTLYQPHLAVKIGDREVAPVVQRSSIGDPQALAVARAGMRDAVLAGSARSLQSVPLPVAAKTGTAQWNSNRPNHAWVTTFLPADKPELVVTVLVEEGEEGSRTATPVARAILEFYAQHRINPSGD